MAIGHSLETFSTLCRQTHADDDGTSPSHRSLPFCNVTVVSIVAFLE
jgi:hypothetical protein